MYIMSLRPQKVLERRKYEIKNVLKKGIVFVMFLSILICAGMSTLSVSADNSEISNHNSVTTDETFQKIVNEITDNEIVISLTDKIPLEELEEQFPKEMEVILSDGTKELISVTWNCECDYENEEYDSYVFEVVLP